MAFSIRQQLRLSALGFFVLLLLLVGAVSLPAGYDCVKHKDPKPEDALTGQEINALFFRPQDLVPFVAPKSAAPPRSPEDIVLSMTPQQRARHVLVDRKLYSLRSRLPRHVTAEPGQPEVLAVTGDRYYETFRLIGGPRERSRFSFPGVIYELKTLHRGVDREWAQRYWNAELAGRNMLHAAQGPQPGSAPIGTLTPALLRHIYQSAALQPVLEGARDAMRLDPSVYVWRGGASYPEVNEIQVARPSDIVPAHATYYMPVLCRRLAPAAADAAPAVQSGLVLTFVSQKEFPAAQMKAAMPPLAEFAYPAAPLAAQPP